MNPQDLLETALTLELSRYSGVITMAVIALAALGWTARQTWRLGSNIVRWVMPKRSEVLQAAIDALDHPDNVWDGKTLMAGPMTVTMFDGVHGEAHNIQAGGCDLKASLSTSEYYTLLRHIRRRVRKHEADQLASKRMVATTALRGGTVPMPARRTA